MILSNFLSDTQTLVFGYTKWTSGVSFTGSFLDIVFGHYFRRGMGKNTVIKNAERVRRRQFFLGNIADSVIFV